MEERDIYKVLIKKTEGQRGSLGEMDVGGFILFPARILSDY
jgi:hypothetical protein